jgi:hypothetical protein
VPSHSCLLRPIEPVLSVMSAPPVQHNLLGLDEHFAVGGINKIQCTSHGPGGARPPIKHPCDESQRANRSQTSRAVKAASKRDKALSSAVSVRRSSWILIIEYLIVEGSLPPK